MKIHVEYKGFLNTGKIKLNPVVEVPKGTTIYDLYLKIGIQEEDHGSLQSFVNNDASWKSTILKDNDHVTIVSIVTGG